MQIFKNDFDTIYDKLSSLNEAKETTTLGNFRGYLAGGMEVTDTAVKSLASFVDVPKTLEMNPNIDFSDNPENWPIEKGKLYSYYFRCPKCLGIYAKAASNIATKKSEMKLKAKKYNRNIPIEEFCLCQFCAKQSRVDKNTGEVIEGKPLSTRPDLVKMIHPSIAIDGKLTAHGCDVLYELNYEYNNVGTGKHQVSSKLMDMIKNSPGMDLAKLSLDSPLLLMWKCQNSEHSAYYSPIEYVKKYTHKGCSDCLDQSDGKQFSISEKIVADMFEEYLANSNLNYKIKAGYKDPSKHSFLPPKYNAIDVYLEVEGRKYGIEYDGRRYHQTQEAIDVDIAKTIHCINSGLEIIRIREADCHEWSSINKSAPTIKIFNIKRCFSALPELQRKEIIEDICKYIGIL